MSCALLWWKEAAGTGTRGRSQNAASRVVCCNGPQVFVQANADLRFFADLYAAAGRSLDNVAGLGQAVATAAQRTSTVTVVRRPSRSSGRWPRRARTQTRRAGRRPCTVQPGSACGRAAPRARTCRRRNRRWHRCAAATPSAARQLDPGAQAGSSACRPGSAERHIADTRADQLRDLGRTARSQPLN
jgi:hypothetical protein